MGLSGHVAIFKEGGTSFDHENFISVVLSFGPWGSVLLLVDVLSELTSLDELLNFFVQLSAVIRLMTVIFVVFAVLRVVPPFVRGLHLP